MDVLNLFVDLAKKRAPGGAILSSQDRYVSQVKQEMVGSVETAFEPLLENHIGNRVVFELKKGEETELLSGILKDYTADFLEILDVNYKGVSDSSCHVGVGQ